MVNEDGPRPMKFGKPTEKNPNSADQFWNEHQAIYEARSKETNRVVSVEDHNKVYPKLNDELNRRRSTAQCPAKAAMSNIFNNSQEVLVNTQSQHSSQVEGSLHTESFDTLKTLSSYPSVSSYNSFGTFDQEPMAY